MTPRQPIVDAGRFYLREQRKSPGAPGVPNWSTSRYVPWASINLHRSILRRRLSSMPFALATGVDLAARRWLRGPGVEWHTGSRRRLGGRTGRQPGRGARRDGRQSHGRTEGAHDEGLERVRPERARRPSRRLPGRGGRRCRRVQSRHGRTADAADNRRQRHARRQMLQAAYRRAAEVPLEAARLSLTVLELSRAAALEGRADAASGGNGRAARARRPSKAPP